MRAFLQVSLMAFCVALTAADYTRGSLSGAADLSLIQFMLRTSDLSQGNSARSMDCFTYYVPVLNAITAQYEESYAHCLDTAEAKREAIDDSTQEDRDHIERVAKNSCEALNSCLQWENSVTYFECYVKAGSDNSKAMYTISANASDVLARVQEEYRLVDNQQDRCTNQSERIYVEDTSYTYDQLQSCLQGKSPVPQPTPTGIPTSTEWWPSETTAEPNAFAVREQKNSDTSRFAKKDVSKRLRMAMPRSENSHH